MTDLEIAAALRDAIAAAPTAYPQTRAMLARLAPRPIVLRVEAAPIHEPVASASPPVEHRVAGAIEQEIIRILDSAPQPGETIAVAFRRRECELGTLFAELGALDAYVLHKRLATPRPDDLSPGGSHASRSIDASACWCSSPMRVAARR